MQNSKYFTLIASIFILSFIANISANEEVQIVCGGNQEVQISCLGDEELMFWGSLPESTSPTITTSGGTQKIYTSNDFLNGIIVKIISNWILFFILFILFIMFLLLILFIILYYRKKKKNER